MDSLAPKHDFIGLEECTYLYTGAESAPLKSLVLVLSAYLLERARAEAGRAVHAQTEQRCKEHVAALLNRTPDEIAIVGSASEGIVLVAGGIRFQAGDNIVTNDLEFPSTVLPWLQLKERDVEVRVLRSRQWQITPDDYAHAIDGRTRLVTASHVSYLSGLRQDIRAIADLAHAHGALMLADVTQSLGVVPVDVANCDFAVASTYKWLLGVHGGGVLFWNRQRLPDFAPGGVGWFSVKDLHSPHRFERFEWKPTAARFELGMPTYPAIYALAEGVRYLRQFGIPRIASHVLQLGEELIGGLKSQGWTIMTPAQPELRAGNIAIATDQAIKIRDALLAEHIHVWGGDGRVRASLHLYNDSQDTSRLLEALRPFAPRR
jgi:cysteine desulfurase/selenocysteine lyase